MADWAGWIERGPSTRPQGLGGHRVSGGILRDPSLCPKEGDNLDRGENSPHLINEPLNIQKRHSLSPEVSELLSRGARFPWISVLSLNSHTAEQMAPGNSPTLLTCLESNKPLPTVLWHPGVVLCGTGIRVRPGLYCWAIFSQLTSFHLHTPLCRRHS